MPPKEANNSPPSEGSGVVSYRLAKKSILSKLNYETIQTKHKGIMAHKGEFLAARGI
jgi:hypothetical protein